MRRNFEAHLCAAGTRTAACAQASCPISTPAAPGFASELETARIQPAAQRAGKVNPIRIRPSACRA